MNRWSCTLALFLIPLAVACFALSPEARAVCQQGCDANQNTALGDAALVSITTGPYNTANGNQCLRNNTTGGSNTAIGSNALLNNTIGNNNTANGASALYSNTSGFQNTASGVDALGDNTTGIDNTATGLAALASNTTGNNNIAVGFGAGDNLTTGSYNIDIGNEGVAGESNTIRIGKQGTQTATFIAGIRGTPITGGIPVGGNQQRSTWRGTFLAAFQGGSQADGQSERSDLVAQAGDVPLQTRP